MSNEKNQKGLLLEIVNNALAQDNVLRNELNIGDKFRFIRDRLRILEERVEAEVKALQQKEKEESNVLAEDETLVYVYLFNAQGVVFQTWQKMVNPSVFYEYSINRPVYQSRQDIEAVIRGKPNKAQHGFLTIAVQKADILQASEHKDAFNHQLLKVKEGALKAKRLISFTHNNNEYTVNPDGQLEKKSSDR